MDAVVVANGDWGASARLVELWKRADLRLAADGGSRHARLALGAAPHVVIGDLDSIDDETREWLELAQTEHLIFPAAKDATDLELAVDLALERGAQRVTILAALGGRMDQALANMLLLARRPEVRLVDASGEMWAATREAAIEGAAGDIVSLLPLDDAVRGVVTDDLQYPLKHEDLPRGGTRGVSNVMLAPHARVTWDAGLMMVVHLAGSAVRRED